METKVQDIQALTSESWGKLDRDTRETRSIKPVAKTEGTQTNRVGKQKDNAEARSTDDIAELVKNVQDYLADLNINLNFKIDDKTGDVIVKVLNGKTGKLIRQLPPDDLIKLRKKLEELRGVLFDGKA